MAITSSLGIRSIGESVNSLGVSISRAKRSTFTTSQILMKRTKVKRSSLFEDRRIFQQKREKIRIKDKESIIETSRLVNPIRKGVAAISRSAKGFLGRLMDFVGTLLTGWLLYNLPTIIAMAKELMARIVRMVELLKGFVGNLTSIMGGFGSLLGAVFKNVISFDFNDSSGRVKKEMDKLTGVFDDMKSQVQEGIDLITTSLGEGKVTGENAPPTGTKYPSQPGEEVSEGTSGQGGKLQPIHKQALDIISKPESGGDYNAMNRGKAGDSKGGSKKWIGKNLTDMTIGEVRALQNQPGKLHAAGRYQIVPVSLPTAQAAAGLKDTDMFDKNNQDLLAIGLLKTQGPPAWTQYSSYSKKEIDIMYKAKDTPLGSATPTPKPSQFNPAPIDMDKRYRRKGEDIRKQISRGVEYTQITDLYGSRGGTHRGLDIGAPNGTYIALRYDCEVVAAGTYGKYGNVIDVWVPQLGVQLRMAHLSAILIRSGKIKAGTSFARVGKTGRATGPHIHFEYDKVRGRSNYGGSGDPSAYVSALLLTKTSNQGTFTTPVISATPTPTPAQIAAQPQQRSQQLPGQLTPERKGSQIILIDDSQPQQPPAPTGGGGGGGIIPIVINPLNSYITKKLMFDLAYT